MAITHTETVTLMEVLTANSDNIVGKVVVNIASSDDSNASKYKWDGSASFVLNTTTPKESPRKKIPNWLLFFNSLIYKIDKIIFCIIIYFNCFTYSVHKILHTGNMKRYNWNI